MSIPADDGQGSTTITLNGHTSYVMPTVPTFERTADSTLEKVHAIYAQRGGEYRDSWDVNNQCIALTFATLERFGIKGLTPEQLRLLQLAALIDVKDSRLTGVWNPDSLIDGIAYRAAYTTLRDEWESSAAPDGS